MFFTLLEGFSIGASLIIAIGAQNAFVIKQGLKKQHLLVTALLCSIIDSALIIAGVIGFGHVISEYPITLQLAKYFAVIFLFIYGALSFKAALHTKALMPSSDNSEAVSIKKTVLIILALSLLNPHVYMDTVILLGTIASQRPMNEQPYFAFGAILASFSWFFGITYGARFLSPLLQKESSWRILEIIIGITMWAIALTLLNVM